LSSLWLGSTDSYWCFSLTVHGINKEWKRIKHVLCVQPFSGSHNFETIGDKVNQMLRKWEIPIEKCHVFLSQS
jgi:hypothetical protein